MTKLHEERLLIDGELVPAAAARSAFGTTEWSRDRALRAHCLRQLHGGGVWFHPGFMERLDDFELPISPPSGLRGPGPASRPDLVRYLGEYPCAAVPDEIVSGNLEAFLNLEPNVNRLTSKDDVDPLTGMPWYSGTEVSLSRVGTDAVRRGDPERGRRADPARPMRP